MAQRSNTPSPDLVLEPSLFRATMDESRALGRRVGFVPTMGALHAGHIALVNEARARVGKTGCVAVSIFVNPTQFGPNEDFSRYPRDLDADLARCAEAGVDVVFAPDPEAMYPVGDQTRVRVSALAEPFCGPFRPGHFEGVATIVAKLFALVGPCTAVFGRKDYQQLRVISQMASDLFMPVDVVGLETVREPDGLAMSSRNRYLNAADRARARAIPLALSEAVRNWDKGERDVDRLLAGVRATVGAAVDSIDYVDAREANRLRPVDAKAERVVIALAVRVGGARLIDNVVLGEDRAPVSE
jgi:pantoate--beta-alanine ligase